MMRIAFYKGKGTFIDKLIRLYTRSTYSHCEVVIDEYWYSISPRDSVLREKCIKPVEGHWDYITVPCLQEDIIKILKLYNKYKNAQYDWKGILLAQFLKLKAENPNKLFCSEWCAMVVDSTTTIELSKIPAMYNPGNLYDELLALTSNLKDS